MMELLMNRRSFILGGLLTASGIAAGTSPAHSEITASRPVSLEFWYINLAQYEALARLLPPVFASVGIDFKPRSASLSTMFGKMYRQQEYGDMAATAWATTPERMDPDFWLYDVHHSKGGRNFIHYRNAEYDRIVNEQREKVNEEQRKKLVWRAQELLAQDQPSLYLSYENEYFAWNKDLFSAPKPAAGLAADWGNLHSFLELEPKTNRKVAVVADQGDFKSMNILSVGGSYEMQILRHIYDTLVRLDYSGRVVPWAASRISWLDPTALEVTLRDNMSFHDGKPVRPADVKFSFDYLKRWQPPLLRSFLNYERVDLSGGSTLRITLPRPHAPFVAIDLGFIPILPEHVWHDIPSRVGLSDPGQWEVVPQVIGSGPFKFSRRAVGQEIVLERNSRHFAAPKLEGYIRKEYATLDGMVTALELKEADLIVRRLTKDRAERLERKPHLGVGGALTARLHYIALDLRRRPMNDVAFRRAIDHLIDKDQWVFVAERGGAVAGRNTPISPALATWHNPNCERHEFSVDKARAVLKSAGYSWDKAGKLIAPGGY